MQYVLALFTVCHSIKQEEYWPRIFTTRTPFDYDEILCWLNMIIHSVYCRIFVKRKMDVNTNMTAKVLIT